MKLFNNRELELLKKAGVNVENRQEFTSDDNNYIFRQVSEFIMNHSSKNGDLRAMFSGAYIVTNDGYIVCVLNNYYENELEFEILNLVGGMADANDIIDGKYSSSKSLQREFKEELGFNINSDNVYYFL